MAIANFFDVPSIAIGEIFGDPILAVIVGLIIIWYVALKANVPYQVTGLVSIVFLGMMFEETRIITIWAFLGLAVGTSFYFIVAKAIKR